MKALVILPLIICFSFNIHSQEIPKDANIITVTGVTYTSVLNALLDLDYEIDNKDNDLQTASTRMIRYNFDHGYRLNIRVKDSVLYIKGLYTWPYKSPLSPYDNKTPIYLDKQAVYDTNRKGEFQVKSESGYVFNKMIILAMKLGGNITYTKEER